MPVGRSRGIMAAGVLAMLAIALVAVLAIGVVVAVVSFTARRGAGGGR
jgi:hypothetical protein